jgi:hypothetical protein
MGSAFFSSLLIGPGIEFGVSNHNIPGTELKQIPFKSATLELFNIEIPGAGSLRKIVNILKSMPY